MFEFTLLQVVSGAFLVFILFACVCRSENRRNETKQELEAAIEFIRMDFYQEQQLRKEFVIDILAAIENETQIDHIFEKEQARLEDGV